MKKIGFSDIDITDGFWKIKQDMVRNTTVKAVYERFKDTHRFDALECKWKEGDSNMPHIYWDSDVAKWIEGVAYIIEKEHRPELKALADNAIDNIVKNSDENGYFNSHFLVTRKSERFMHRREHELYCAGHLIEAAVAYYNSTGDDKLLKSMCKYADYIDKVFRIEKSAAFITPGHPELELALVKLYGVTGEKRYLELAEYFIDEHGRHTDIDEKTFHEYTLEYNQDEIPLKDRTTVDGHSVRALYLYSAACDVAILRNDKELADACRRIFENVTNRRMYITGGVGSAFLGEAFTLDYDLPNRTAYAETCAAISLAFFASRMQMLEVDSKYADCVERVIYNGFLSGVSMDGKAFFYENPLEIDPDFNNPNVSTKDKTHFPITERKEVFDCSCCPPNVVRFIPSIADFMYSYDDEALYVHQFMNSTAECDGIRIEQITKYPENGKVKIICDAGTRKVAIRIPGWCRHFDIDKKYELKNGYAFTEPGEINITFDMPASVIRANRRVHDCSGRVAIMRGPVVYCAEGIDNGADIKNIRVDIRGDFSLAESEFLLPLITASGYQQSQSDNLYRFADDDWKEVTLKLIPYYAFANRGTTEMAVWLLEK